MVPLKKRLHADPVPLPFPPKNVVPGTCVCPVLERMQVYSVHYIQTLECGEWLPSCCLRRLYSYTAHKMHSPSDFIM